MIDTDRIQELRAEIGDEDLSFIVSIYVEEARTTLRQVASGLPRLEYARAVHFLRSGALNIGLCGIATLASQLETDLAADDAEAQVRGTKALGDILDHTMAQLEATLA